MLASNVTTKLRQLSKDIKKLIAKCQMKDAVIEQQAKRIVKLRRELNLAHAALSVEQTINSQRH